MKLSLKELKTEGAYIEKFPDKNIIHLLGDSYSDDLFMEWVNSTEGDVDVYFIISEIPEELMNDNIIIQNKELYRFLNNIRHIFIHMIGNDRNTFNQSELDSMITKILYTTDVPKGTYLGTIQTKWQGSKKDTVVNQYLVK